MGPNLMDRIPVPRRQVVEPVDFVAGQPVQEIGDIGLRMGQRSCLSIRNSRLPGFPSPRGTLGIVCCRGVRETLT